MSRLQRIAPCLWFDHQAEQAANFYASIFPNSRIVQVNHYREGGPGAVGSVLTVDFVLDGVEMLALNGGPQFAFTEAVSLAIQCETQEEVDHYWYSLSAGGKTGECGWLMDRYGLSWQVVPDAIPALLGGDDPERATRVFQAVMASTKPDIATLLRAARGD